MSGGNTFEFDMRGSGTCCPSECGLPNPDAAATLVVKYRDQSQPSTITGVTQAQAAAIAAVYAQNPEVIGDMTITLVS